MADIDQGGVSPATAGGAPVPAIPPAQVRATAEYLARMVGCTLTEVRGPGDPAPIGEPGTGYWIPYVGGRCPELNRDGELCGLAYGHAGEHSTPFGVFRWGKWGQLDSRIDEIERLRGLLREITGERDRVTIELEQVVTVVGGDVDFIAEERDKARSAVVWALGQLEEQRDEARAERDRLRAELDEHLADENSAQAANDRLRDEIEQLRPTFRPGQRVRIGLCNGIVVTPKDVTRVQLEGTLYDTDYPTRVVDAIPDGDKEVPF